MVKTHEINLDTTTFNQFINADYIVLQADNIEVQDYILFKQVTTVDGEAKDTGLFRMTQVRDIIQNDGFKDGHALLLLNKL